MAFARRSDGLRSPVRWPSLAGPMAFARLRLAARNLRSLRETCRARAASRRLLRLAGGRAGAWPLLHGPVESGDRLAARPRRLRDPPPAGMPRVRAAFHDARARRGGAAEGREARRTARGFLAREDPRVRAQGLREAAGQRRCARPPRRPRRAQRPGARREGGQHARDRRARARGARRAGHARGRSLRIGLPQLRERRRLRRLLPRHREEPVTPEHAMRLALAQARRASGRTFPNPPVGAVVFRGDEVLGLGSTRPVGGAHAEIVAIENAMRRHGRRAVRGASLAVTLEPCSHIGRTPPCADRVIDAGVANVWIGHRDPHPAVAGRGIARLRRAGRRVEVGVLERECREQHRGFLSVLASGRPFIALKRASSLDGRIATSAGESRWITGPAARATVHRLRRRADAIWVGADTALEDDPELTARSRGRIVHRPVRIVADTRLCLPPSARMLRGAPGSTWVLCGADAPRARRRALEAAGARVLEIACEGDQLDLRRALRRLGQEGLTEILVEGGGRLAAGLLRRSLVDELHWFSAPLVIGGDGRTALDALGVRSLAAAPRLASASLRRLGDDAYWIGRFAPAARRARGATR